MGFADLLPYLTGGGGAIVALAFGYWLILSEKLVTGSAHRRLLKQYEKLEEANDVLRTAVTDARSQTSELLNSNQLTNKLVDTLMAMAHGRNGGSGGTG